MEPIDIWGALRRSWRLLVVLALVGAVVAVLVPVGHAKRVKSALPYASSVLVGTPPNGIGSPLRGGVTSQQILFFATSSDTLQATSSAAGLNVPSYVMSAYVSASVLAVAGATPAGATAPVRKGTPTDVELTARAADPADAVNLANTYADQVGQAVESGLSGSSRFVGADSGYTVLQPAVSAFDSKVAVKASLTASRKVRGLGGLAVGAIVAIGLVLLRELLDKRLRSAARAEAVFGFPVVGEIPLATVAGTAAVPGLIPMVDVVRDSVSPGAEAYRMLRMSVMFENLASLSGPADPFALGSEGDDLFATEVAGTDSASSDIGSRQVILVVSPGTETTRPHVAANLAAIYAEAEQSVVVISTGSLDVGFGPTNESFAGDIGEQDVEAQLEPSILQYVRRLPLSPFMTKSGQLANRAPAILNAARNLSDVVIVEVPPLLALHHAEALMHVVDVVLVVAESKFTTFDDARRAGDLLRRMGAPVLGVVLTNVPLNQRDVRQLALPRPVEPPVGDESEEAGHAIPADVGAGSGAASPSQV
jgi:succinoglycan biosynthesis transport protein ExoP